jgi:hypothetical protein
LLSAIPVPVAGICQRSRWTTRALRNFWSSRAGQCRGSRSRDVLSTVLCSAQESFKIIHSRLCGCQQLSTDESRCSPGAARRAPLIHRARVAHPSRGAAESSLSPCGRTRRLRRLLDLEPPCQGGRLIRAPPCIDFPIHDIVLILHRKYTGRSTTLLTPRPRRLELLLSLHGVTGKGKRKKTRSSTLKGSLDFLMAGLDLTPLIDKIYD